MKTIKDLERILSEKKGQKQLLKQQLETETLKLTNLNNALKRLEEVRVIIQEVAKVTQNQLEYHISDIATLALEAVFPDPYKLCVDFESKRGRTEAVITIERDGQKIDPLTASGGGVVDIVAFALRVSLWSLMAVKTRPTIILDEPFRFLSRDLQERASKLLSELSERLDLQFILVSHEQTLIENADNVIEVTQRKGISYVK